MNSNDFIEIHETKNNENDASFNGYFYNRDSAEGLAALLADWEERLQVIYMDPPFYTGQNFNYQQKRGDVVFSQTAYSDKWESREHFLGMFRSVVEAAYRLLKPEGSMFVHIDYRLSAYVRILMDEIFGEDNFLNEIIWNYKSGGRAKNYFSRKHDTILFYRKTKLHYFDIAAVGIARGSEKRNNMKHGIDEEGREYWSIKSNGKEYRYYENSMIYPSDVWDDISHLQQKDPERTGYDTQKPEALLERLIKSSSRPGDWVGDFFAGSGTTLAAAQKNGRNWIGMDKGIFSLNTSRKRLVDCLESGLIAFNYEMDKLSDMRFNKNVFISESKGSTILSDGKFLLKLNATGDREFNIILSDYIIEKKDSFENYLDYIDYWAAGTICHNTFNCISSTYRTFKDQSLLASLDVKIENEEDIAVHIVDIYGRQFVYKLPCKFEFL